MREKKPRIVFMGTPEFAVPSLQILVQNDYEVGAVVTTTDKRGGRGGKQLIESAVKKYALAHGIPVLQPEKLRDPTFLQALERVGADLFVVVAFRMLPQVVWAMPPLGTFNLHGSLLPKYRGAAPIHWAVIQGETETGVTTFFIQKEIDTGDIILQKRMPIGPDETAGQVHDRMMVLGAEAVLETVRRIEAGPVQLQKQDDQQATKAPKIFRETCEINFDQSVKTVYDFIRGLSPHPAAWTTLDGNPFKIIRASPIQQPLDLRPGTLISDGRKRMGYACRDGWIEVLKCQLQGKRKMKTSDFLNGYGLAGYFPLD